MFQKENVLDLPFFIKLYAYFIRKHNIIFNYPTEKINMINNWWWYCKSCALMHIWRNGVVLLCISEGQLPAYSVILMRSVSNTLSLTMSTLLYYWRTLGTKKGTN